MTLVTRSHELPHMAQRGRRVDDALPDLRVAAHEFPFFLVQRTGLVQDRVRDRYLADVVSLGRELGPIHLGEREPEAFGRQRR